MTNTSHKGSQHGIKRRANCCKCKTRNLDDGREAHVPFEHELTLKN